MNRILTAAGLLLILTLASNLPTGAAEPAPAKAGVLDPNLATEKELLAVPHLDEKIVKGLVARRPFLSATDLDVFLAGSLDSTERAEAYVTLFLPINLNTAPRGEILLVPGVGRKMAHEFEEYRPWKAITQFRKEIGKYVDEKEVARLEQYVFVPVNLNAASDAEILAIPGVGRKMLHEFKEYRPWTSVEQFRKEIGKYVDAKEVARLERYVVIP